ncbi:cytochrome b/b6 domain-containing protein [Rhodoferax aquaticus]|uniref:Cytochrome B n=1 Tax=Rhodoferax aquaticus TaxID=2527691 RepID=A0A515EUV4_9BURK|nr:cytochrome b/b6 domain-containing protein [Rhodoferax aquaticus]QDL56343.1 cytochrome B [Rhodoferax aquaticus]
MVKVRVWDLPTRLFHWGLAACVVGLVITGQIGGGAMEWHFRLGFAVLSLLVFRIVWGFVGGRWSRFSSFTYSPRSLLRYAQGESEPSAHVGHHPLGALSVYALLLALVLQASAGMLSDDEISNAGPFAKLVSSRWVELATFFHTEVGKLALIGLVTLHVVAVLVYRFKKREDLLTPMLTGDKILDFSAPAARDDKYSRLLALAIFVVSLAGVFTLVGWAG